MFSHPSKEYIAKYSEKYKLLSTAIKAGLLHPQCRHTIATYFEGITRIPKIYDKAEATRTYRAEQKQRQLENKIRLAKRINAGVMDEENEREATAMLRNYQKQLRDHLKAHPELKRHAHREKIYDIKASLGNSSSNIKSNSEGKYIETIDTKDIDKFVEKYENEIKDYPVEQAFIIHSDGKVMQYTGDRIGVQFPTANLKGSVITHNHPVIDGEDSNSFQKDDYTFLQNYGMQIDRLRATYGDVRYEVRVLKDLSNTSYNELMRKVSEEIDIYADTIDFGHLIFKRLNMEGYVEYAKTKVE